MTYRPRLSRPTLIVRARTQTLRLEVWDDSALAEPSAGGHGDDHRRERREVVSAASVTIGAAWRPTASPRQRFQSRSLAQRRLDGGLGSHPRWRR